MDGAGTKMGSKKAQQIYLDYLSSRKNKKDFVSSGLREKLHEKLIEASETRKTEQKKDLFLRIVFATAAVFIIVFASVLSLNIDESEDTTERRLVYSLSVPQGRPVTVTLSYDAVEKCSDVKFSIKLDDGIYFHSQNNNIRNLKEHSWKGTLKKGTNNIPFVVGTESLGKKKITVSATYNDFVHLQEVILDATEKDVSVSLYSFDPVPVI